MDAESSINTIDEAKPVLEQEKSGQTTQIEELEQINDDDEKLQDEKPVHKTKILNIVDNTRNIIAFFLCGLMNNYSLSPLLKSLKSVPP